MEEMRQPAELEHLVIHRFADETGVLRGVALVGEENVAEDDAAVTLTTREPARVLGELAQRDALDGLSMRGATLEDVFLELTGREYRA